jgi:hypothetical protein
MKCRWSSTSLLLVALLAPLAAAAAQEEQPAPPSVTPTSGRSIKLEGQLQVQLASSSVDSAVGWDADLRRMRITAIGDAGHGFSGALQTDFGSNRVRIRDAFIDYKASPQVTLRAGQFKIPFNGIETVSSKRLLMIERGNTIRGLPAETTSRFVADSHLSARNRGFMAIVSLPGDRFVLQAGGWHGNGENAENDDGKEVAARLEYSALPLPEKTSRPLVLGVAAVANGYFGSPRDTLEVVSGDTVEVRDARYAAAYEGWVEYGKYLLPGLHVAGNVITGENPTELEVEDGALEFASFLGLQGWGEFLVETGGEVLTGWAPAIRADRFDPDTDAEDDANVLVTPGLNLYFGSNVKAQLNYDVLLPEDGDRDTESAFRFQTQVLF